MVMMISARPPVVINPRPTVIRIVATWQGKTFDDVGDETRLGPNWLEIIDQVEKELGTEISRTGKNAKATVSSLSAFIEEAEYRSYKTKNKID
jgi:hypothetical protein